MRSGSYTDDEVRRATDMYFEGGMSHADVCKALGYPGHSTLSRWTRDDPRYLDHRIAQAAASVGGGGCAKSPRKSYSYEVKLEAVRLAEESRLTRREIAEALDLCAPAMVSKWVTIARKHGKEALMPKTRGADAVAADAPANEPEQPVDIGAVMRENARLRMDNAILEETIKALKKDPGVDPSDLTNREKTVVADALRERFALADLLARLGLARSTYYYERSAIAAGDKYAELRKRVAEVFYAARESRGYRYVTAMLRRGDDPVVVSEKVVRRIMREDGLRVLYNKRRRGYSSYVGEVSGAPDNLVGRDFHAGAPNELWLTDITEFKIPAGKVYLSPILDCYEGYLPAWSIGPRPTAELANSSLLKACATLAEGESPTGHSDRGGHYRWPGWISICEEHGITRSMSAKGCSPDNSACEGLFGRLKNEFFYHRDWCGVTLEEFMERLDAYLVYYNEGRPKESLGWMTPAQKRAAFYEGVVA